MPDVVACEDDSREAGNQENGKTFPANNELIGNALAAAETVTVWNCKLRTGFEKCAHNVRGVRFSFFVIPFIGCNKMRR